MKVLAALFLALSCGVASAQPELQRSHIEANVPPADAADAYFRRDLLQFFQAAGYPEATGVQAEALRLGPTQSGVAYPKFYFWVSLTAQGKPLITGAVRVAAIERQRFEITDFVSAADVRAKPDRLARVFPAALIDSIVGRAAR